jgi:hypothetical protein
MRLDIKCDLGLADTCEKSGISDLSLVWTKVLTQSTILFLDDDYDVSFDIAFFEGGERDLT